MNDMVRGGYRESNYCDYCLLEIMQACIKAKFVKNEIAISLQIIFFNIRTQSESLFLIINVAIGKSQHQIKAAPNAVIFMPN